MSRVTPDKLLRDQAFNIAKNPKCDGCQRKLSSIAFKCFDIKYSVSGVTLAFLQTLATLDKSAIKDKIMSNQNLST